MGEERSEPAARVKDLASLTKFLRICRRQGVADIKFGDVAVTFGPMPVKAAGAVEEDDDAEPSGDEPSEQEIADWSIPR